MKKKMRMLFFCMLTAVSVFGCGNQHRVNKQVTQDSVEITEKKQYFQKVGIPDSMTDQLDDQQIHYLSARLHENEGPLYGGLCGKVQIDGGTGCALYFLDIKNDIVQGMIIETMCIPEDITAFHSEASSSFAWDEDHYVYTGKFRHESGGVQNRKYEVFEEGDNIFQNEHSEIKWTGMLSNPDNNIAVTKVYDNAEIHLKPAEVMRYESGKDYGKELSFHYEMEDRQNMVLKTVVICIMIFVIFVGICWQNRLGPKNYEMDS